MHPFNIQNKEQEELNKMSPWLVAPSMFDKQWDMSKQYLDFTVAEFRKKNIPVYIAFLSLGALAPGLDKAYENHATMLNKNIEEWAKLNGINFFSLLPVIKDLMEKIPVSDLMIKDDGHPTPKAHKIITDTLWEWITSQS